MQTAKSGSHTIWNCKYHIVWVTKYRYPVLVGDVGLRARELLREISRIHEMSIHSGAINRDHVHLLLSIPPHLSGSSAVQYLKGKSSHNLLTEYQSLRNRYWGQHLWSRGYWVATSGNVTDEVWKKYIEDQKPEEPDDVQEICTLGSAWGDEFKKPRSLGEGTGAKASDNSEAPKRATASRLVSTILRI